MDQRIRDRNADDVSKSIHQVRDNFNGQQQNIRTLVDQAVDKPVTASRCLCTPPSTPN
jgi:hypothetical protein